MFEFTRRPPRTIAEAIAQKKHFVFTCAASETISRKEGSGIFFKHTMELTILEQISACPECGASNFPGFAQKLFLTVER